MWEYKVGINVIIAYFVCMWKSRIYMSAIGNFSESIPELPRWLSLESTCYMVVLHWAPFNPRNFHLSRDIYTDMDIHGKLPLDVVMLIRSLMCTDVY